MVALSRPHFPHSVWLNFPFLMFGNAVEAVGILRFDRISACQRWRDDIKERGTILIADGMQHRFGSDFADVVRVMSEAASAAKTEGGNP